MAENGKHILIVEDEALLAIDLQFVLADMHYGIIGPAADNVRALELIGSDRIDAAILDLNLQGETSKPVADRLAELEIPFLFLSGHTRDFLPEQHRDRPLVGKPFAETHLLGAISALLG